MAWTLANSQIHRSYEFRMAVRSLEKKRQVDGRRAPTSVLVSEERQIIGLFPR